MDKNYLLITGGSIKEHELRLLGELLIVMYNNAYIYKHMIQKVEENSSALTKHSSFLKKANALKWEAEQYRLLSCLYESAADRPAVCEFLDAVVDLIK